MFTEAVEALIYLPLANAQQLELLSKLPLLLAWDDDLAVKKIIGPLSLWRVSFGEPLTDDPSRLCGNAESVLLRFHAGMEIWGLDKGKRVAQLLKTRKELDTGSC